MEEFISYFLLSLIIISLGEIILNRNKLKKNVFVDRPKAWHHYVRAAMKRVLTHKTMKNLSNPSFAEYKVNFIRYNHLMLNRNMMKKEVRHFQNILKVRQYWARDTTWTRSLSVKNPLGSLNILYHRRFNRPQYQKGALNIVSKDTSKVIDQIYFTLDNQLRLNITFYELHFGSPVFSGCVFGSVIVNASSRLIRKNWEKWQHTSTYCGSYNNIPFYSPHRQIKIQITVIKITEFSALMNYSVIDVKSVSSHSVLGSTAIIPTWIVHFSKTETLVSRFHIETEKYNIIKLLESDVSVMEVYDGPGTLSPLLKPTHNKVYFTSTFQCTLYLWKYTKTKKLDFIDVINYLVDPKRITKEMHINSTTKQIISYSQHIQTKVNTFKLMTKADFTLNITISHLTFQDIDDPLCMYNGLTTYQMKNDSFTEMSTVCSNPSYNYKFRNIYPKTPLVLLILYAYKEYGNISINIILSVTECKPVTINSCDFTPPRSYIYYYEYQQKHSKVILVNSTYIPDNRPGHSHINYFIDVGKCLIFQFTYNITRIHKHECEITKFGHAIIEQTGIVVNYNISGYIEGIQDSIGFSEANSTIIFCNL